MKTNKHGLSRYIPRKISREIRQRCGFGCIICGSAVYTYEHIDPPFSDALEHNPETIALLSAGCHDKVTRGLTSKSTVMACLSRPKTFELGYSREAFDIAVSDPMIKLCGTTYRGIRTVIAMMGTEILKVESPECEGAPMRISALFCDEQGTEIFRVVQNEWFSNAANWDVEVKGQRIYFRRSPRDVALIIRAEPPETIAIEKISMFYQAARVVGHESSPVDAVAPNGARLSMTIRRVTGSGHQVGLFVDNGGILMGYNGTFSSLVEARALL